MATAKLLYQGPEAHTRVLYYDQFTSTDETARLVRECFAHVPLQEHAVRAPFRGNVKVSRRVKAYCTLANVRNYRFAGTRVDPEHPMPEWLSTLKRQAEQRTAEATGSPVNYNYALINYYPDGESALGKHSDDERDMVRGAPIASYSAGAERDMKFHDRAKNDKCIATQCLRSGSLVLMLGNTQHHTKHSIPKRAGVHKPRYNVTFRVMKTR